MLAPMDANGNTVVPKGWANWGIFERNVLKPAKEEINKYTDITIDYTPLKVDYAGKKYRRYVMIKFSLIEKNEDEKRRKNALLDQEYNNYTQYEQLSWKICNMRMLLKTKRERRNGKSMKNVRKK